MDKRVYSGFDFAEFARLWPHLGCRDVVLLTDAQAQLRGDDLDYAEWQALTAAAGTAAEAAAASGTARIVVAADAEVTDTADVDGVLAVGRAELPADAVVSVHVDEHLRHSASADELMAEELLWYAPAEIPGLISDFGG